jgi:hypothetical protein
MADVRLSINATLFEQLKKDTQIENAQLTAEALTLLEWAVEEAKQGRYLITVNIDGNNAKRVRLPSLEMAFKKSYNDSTQYREAVDEELFLKIKDKIRNSHGDSFDHQSGEEKTTE